MALCHNISLAISLVFIIIHRVRSWPEDPTHGFVELPLNTSNFHIQKPYNLPLSDRYSFVDGVHKLWVYSTDEPLSKNSPTNPRTEVLIRGYSYSSDVWQFEGYGYVPCGTSGVCIMQVFGASLPRNTTLQLRVYNGSLTYYGAPILVPNIYDKWFRLNVIHNVNASTVKIYIDGSLKYVAPGRGGNSYYFKFGVYGQDNESHYMESRWKDIKVLKKCV
ncbi:Alginate lyase2 domain-containing protein [Citrus sinensis]|uniref:Alginate lyase2 domain-containing protein n=1 Tax=Citrus sinensis TaxID=2711 RepID=A0ACB8JKB9_CITSI|nr:Alginate lyase2 domain-containing protein [Citrus sinensis]